MKSILFLPEGQDRRGEGGLHTKGYFKKSYEDKPLISIITVVYNGEQYLEETIQSVINQTYDNVEYIIIDGGSTDGTLDIIKKYEDKIDYWVSERDQGIYDAWNKSLQVVTGEWIMFLGADDFLKPNALEKYINLISELPADVEFISAKLDLIDANKNVIAIIGKPWKWKTFKRYMNVAHVGSLQHKNLFLKYGLFEPSFKIAGDYEFLLRAGKNLQAAYLDEVIAQMTNGGVSNQQVALAYQETKRAKMMQHARSPLFCNIDIVWAHIKSSIKSILR